MAALVNDRWLSRRLLPFAKAAGFEIGRFDSRGYPQAIEPDYMLTLADRGADILASWNRLDPELAEALKQEARRRTSGRERSGHMR